MRSFFPPPPRTWVPVPVNRKGGPGTHRWSFPAGDTGETPAPGRKEVSCRNSTVHRIFSSVSLISGIRGTRTHIGLSGKFFRSPPDILKDGFISHPCPILMYFTVHHLDIHMDAVQILEYRAYIVIRSGTCRAPPWYRYTLLCNFEGFQPQTPPALAHLPAQCHAASRKEVKQSFLSDLLHDFLYRHALSIHTRGLRQADPGAAGNTGCTCPCP